MKLRGRKPKLTFSEQIKLRTIQAAFGENSPEVEQFWDAKRASMKATFERKRVYGKQSLDDRRASQRKSSLKYYHTHKDDQTPRQKPVGKSTQNTAGIITTGIKMTLNLFNASARVPNAGKKSTRKQNDRQRVEKAGMARRAPAKAGAGTENRQVQQVRQAQAGKPDGGNRIPGVRLQTVPDELKYYTDCHLCGFRKWCTMDENNKPICIACKTYGVNPRFTKDKCR